MSKTLYMKQKVTHKRARWYSEWRQEWDTRPLCFIDNFSTAIKQSSSWADVTCKKCLKKRNK